LKDNLQEDKNTISILGAAKVKRNPNALGPTAKIAPEGPILGKAPGKKNSTLSKKFFGCSVDRTGKNVIAEEVLNYNEFRNAVNAVSKTCPVCSNSYKNVHSIDQKFCSKNCEEKGRRVTEVREAFKLFNSVNATPTEQNSEVGILQKAGFLPYHRDASGQVRFLFVLSSDPACGGDRFMVAKGNVDKGETTMQAGLREGKEECGVRQNNLIPGTVKLGWRDYITDMLETTALSIFMGEVKDPNAFDTPDYEIAETKWMTPEEFYQTGRKSHIPIVRGCVSKL
jgi:8-oxo-dGTP pyrophosphatase MutT (NUDIX family)/predicted nucleic acid-binding Zn ribbon protein